MSCVTVHSSFDLDPKAGIYPVLHRRTILSVLIGIFLTWHLALLSEHSADFDRALFDRELTCNHHDISKEWPLHLLDVTVSGNLGKVVVSVSLGFRCGFERM